MAKFVIKINEEKFEGSGISSVLNNDESLEAQNLNGFLSIQTLDATSLRKPN